MTGWVASLRENEFTNWEICKHERLFGTGSTRGAGVRSGDILYVWWSQHGLIARAKILEDSRRVQSLAEVPWPDPDRYKFLFRIDVTHSLGEPIEMTWSELDQTAEIGRVPASQFPPVPTKNVPRIDVLFGEESGLATEAAIDPARHHPLSGPTTTYRRAGVAESTTDRRPFELDPDKVDRGLNGHRRTQDALAGWLNERGLEPLSPSGAPSFDIAWQAGDDLFVGEVKSLVPENEVHQIRLAIGQVLEYAHLLNAIPVVVLERRPSNDMWMELTRKLGIRLVWPGAFEPSLAQEPPADS